MDLEIIILSGGSQTKINDITYMWNIKKIIQMNLFIKQNKLMVTEVERRRDKFGIWDQQIQISTYKIDKQQGPTI